MTNLSNRKRFYRALSLSIAVLLSFGLIQCASSKKTVESNPSETLRTNQDAGGTPLSLVFTKGEHHNYPLMVVWTEDTDGKFIETLYVAQSIGTGIYQHGQADKGKWKPGPIRRPAALPYWGHKRGIKASDGLYIPDPDSQMPDAITGATPQDNFILETKTAKEMDKPFKVLLEINQSWDWNEYWTNNKYPDDENYKTSSQPSVVYSATIDPSKAGRKIELKPVGHGHYAGANGELNEDLSTLTTALEIAEKITVEIVPAR